MHYELDLNNYKFTNFSFMIDRRRKKHLLLYVLAGNNLAKKENRFGCFKEGKLFKIWRSFSSDDLIQNRLLASARAIAEEDFLKTCPKLCLSERFSDSKKLAPSLSQKEGPQHMLSKPMWHQPPMKQITQSGREVRSHYGVAAVFGAA